MISIYDTYSRGNSTHHLWRLRKMNEENFGWSRPSVIGAEGAREQTHPTSLTKTYRRARHLRVCRSLKIYSLKMILKIHTVDKLNESKLTGNVNINKMVLPLVSWWWWSCCFCLAEYATTNHCQALQRRAAAGDESATA